MSDQQWGKTILRKNVPGRGGGGPSRGTFFHFFFNVFIDQKMS